MLYLNDNHVSTLELNWQKIADQLFLAVEALSKDQFSQPIKPYLRFNDMINRIIAMPAFLGGGVEKAGIKWIASFPKNSEKGIKRAHSVTVLNDPQTGAPVMISNSAMLSGIRTAGVSALVIRKYLEARTEYEDGKYGIGIVGFGPIGKLHFRMLVQLLGSKLGQVKVYDTGNVSLNEMTKEELSMIDMCDSWESAYSEADIFITCTVSSRAYINQKPKKGSLHLNVSLRDYQPECRKYMDTVIVDDWDEVCRENTDIELMNKTQGLVKEGTYSLVELLCGNSALKSYKEDHVVMFNPMGLAVFDIAVGAYYFDLATRLGIGTILPD